MPPRKILLVDDYRVIRELLKIYLTGSQSTVLEASDGEQALQLLRAERPDVVIADMQMPKLSGLELCRAVAADPTLRHIPVLILTGSTDAQSLAACRGAGAHQVLTKPVAPAVLMSAIERALPSAP